MSRKSKRKHKRRKKLEVPMPEKPQIPATNSVPPKTSWLGRHIGTVLTAIGLIVGLVTLIELSPRLTPGATLPTDRNDPLSSSRFTVTNDGYLPLTDVHAACFVWKAKFRTEMGGIINFNSSFSNIASPRENRLPISEGLTIPCMARSPIGTPSGPPHLTQADLALAVYYRPWPIWFLRCHHLYRFVARFGSNEEIVGWDKQPADVLTPDFDKFMEWRNTQPLLPKL
jgi:hypothetical protein